MKYSNEELVKKYPHHFPCTHCGHLIPWENYDDIPDEDMDIVSNPGQGTFKGWYTCPVCATFMGVLVETETHIKGWSFYNIEETEDEEEEDCEEEEEDAALDELGEITQTDEIIYNGEG